MSCDIRELSGELTHFRPCQPLLDAFRITITSFLACWICRSAHWTMVVYSQSVQPTAGQTRSLTMDLRVVPNWAANSGTQSPRFYPKSSVYVATRLGRGLSILLAISCVPSLPDRPPRVSARHRSLWSGNWAATSAAAPTINCVQSFASSR